MHPDIHSNIIYNCQDGGDICIPMLVHVDVWQKLTQYCKAMILKLKKKKKDMKRT